MFDPHQISARLAVVAGVALLAALIVPSALAVEPMIEGGNEPGSGITATPQIGAAGDPPIVVAASASSFGWSAALVLVLIALTVFAGVLAAHHTAGPPRPPARRRVSATLSSKRRNRHVPSRHRGQPPARPRAPGRAEAGLAVGQPRQARDRRQPQPPAPARPAVLAADTSPPGQSRWCKLGIHSRAELGARTADESGQATPGK